MSARASARRAWGVAAGAALALLGVSGCMLQPPSEDVRATHRLAGKSLANLAFDAPWTGWDDAREPLVSGELLLGWTAGPSDLPLVFQRSERYVPGPMFAGELTATGAVGAVSLAWIKPPEPITIREPFDAIELWIGTPAPAEAKGPPARAPMPEIAVAVEDAAGTRHRFPMGAFVEGRWILYHRALARDAPSGPRFPCRLIGLEIVGWPQPERQPLYFTHLAFFMESRVPLFRRGERTPFDYRAMLFPEMAEKVEGEGFPEGAPAPAAKAVSLRSAAEVAGTPWVFEWACPEGVAALRIDPARPFLGAELWYNGQPVARDAWPFLRPLVGEEPPEVCRREDDGAYWEWPNNTRVRLRAAEAGWRLEIDASPAEATSLSPGVPAGEDLFPLPLPLLNGRDSAAWPYRIWGRPSRGETPALWMAAGFDPFASGASVWTAEGEVRYLPDTNGRVPPLREVRTLRLSTRIEEALPEIRHRPAVRRDEVAQTVWADPPREPAARARQLAAWRALGLRHLVYRVADSEEPAPVRDLDPLEPGWSRDHLLRDPERQWRVGSAPGRYRLKPAQVRARWRLALEEAAAATAWPADAALWVGGWTERTPWEDTDYDARQRDAAQGSRAFAETAGALRETAESTARPLAMGDVALWLYAGLAEGFLVGDEAGAALRGEPARSVFLTHRLNALSVGWGAGAPPKGESERAADPGGYRYLATEIACGLAGRLADPSAGEAAVCRSYYLLQALQERTLRAAPRGTACYDGTRWISASRALADGAAAGPAPLYRLYPGDLEVWVNVHPTNALDIETSRDRWTLPPAGWFARAPDLIEASVVVEGRRVDFCEAEGAYLYYDGGGSETPFRGVACRGAVVFEPPPSGGVKRFEVLDLSGAGRVGLDLSVKGRVRPAAAQAWNRAGEPLGPVRLTAQPDGWTWIEGPPGAFRYLVETAP